MPVLLDQRDGAVSQRHVALLAEAVLVEVVEDRRPTPSPGCTQPLVVAVVRGPRRPRRRPGWRCSSMRPPRGGRRWHDLVACRVATTAWRVLGSVVVRARPRCRRRSRRATGQSASGASPASRLPSRSASSNSEVVTTPSVKRPEQHDAPWRRRARTASRPRRTAAR